MLSRLLETGLSDHHKLISVVMKSGVFRVSPRKKAYRSYKKSSTSGSIPATIYGSIKSL